jgi:hypothetical protein
MIEPQEDTMKPGRRVGSVATGLVWFLALATAGAVAPAGAAAAAPAPSSPLGARIVRAWPAAEEAPYKEGPHGFPLPNDATEGGEVPGGGGKVRVYDVPRGRPAVAAELRKLLKLAGWKITGDEVSPKGTVRLKCEKKGVLIAASIAGTDAASSIILTLP